jgi:hypothetical protein
MNRFEQKDVQEDYDIALLLLVTMTTALFVLNWLVKLVS